ncbi:hypothetical protein CYMTET_25159, partial [Cymbomonas tetramitiformis]
CWTNGVDSSSCEPRGAQALCGECPPGYSGNGYDGCLDTPGCVPGACATICESDVCFELGCTDVPAPGSGYVCDACPAGYLGDGEGVNSALPGAVGCYKNRCFANNGGCDLKTMHGSDATRASEEAGICGGEQEAPLRDRGLQKAR